VTGRPPTVPAGYDPVGPGAVYGLPPAADPFTGARPVAAEPVSGGAGPGVVPWSGPAGSGPQPGEGGVTGRPPTAEPSAIAHGGTTHAHHAATPQAHDGRNPRAAGPTGIHSGLPSATWEQQEAFGSRQRASRPPMAHVGRPVGLQPPTSAPATAVPRTATAPPTGAVPTAASSMERNRATEPVARAGGTPRISSADVAREISQCHSGILIDAVLAHLPLGSAAPDREQAPLANGLPR
jgi:hypothetical protein